MDGEWAFFVFISRNWCGRSYLAANKLWVGVWGKAVRLEQYGRGSVGTRCRDSMVRTPLNKQMPVRQMRKAATATATHT